MTQAVWSTAHGHPLAVTSLAGEQFARLGAHVDPILALFAPFWLDLAEPGAPARRAGGGRRARRASRFTALRSSTSARAGRARLRARLPPHACARLDDAERVPPGRARDAAAPLGVLVPRRGPARALRGLRSARRSDEGARRPGRRRHGALVRALAAPGCGRCGDRAAGAAASAIAVGIVIPHFSPDGRSPSSRAATTRWAARRRASPARPRPTRSPSSARRPRGAISSTCCGWRAVRRCLPAGAAHAPRRRARARAQPALRTRTQTSIHYHYSATALAGLTVGAILGAGRLHARRGWREEPRPPWPGRRW